MDENIGFEETILPEEAQLAEPLTRSFATVGAVYDDGLSLIFDGDEEPTAKHYLCNTAVTFQAGDRVKIAEDSGTYIVEYVVGTPGGGGTAAHSVPSGGAQGQVLTKSSATDYAYGWADVPAEIPATGTTGYVLTKKSNGFGWAAVPDPAHELPSGGSSGQLLTKDGSTNYQVKWADAPIAPAVHSHGDGANVKIYLKFDSSNSRLRVSLDGSNWRNLNFD